MERGVRQRRAGRRGVAAGRVVAVVEGVVQRAIAPRLLGIAMVVAVVSCGLALSARPASAASAKITICHRTHSTTNPYRKITVSQNAVQNARHGGHDLPNGPTNPAVYDPTFASPAKNKNWGDGIPGGEPPGGGA